MTKNDALFPAVIPHPEPVNLAELLTEIETTIKRHVVLPEAAATALAVWVAHTYTFELRECAAYVAIESPEKRCGKSTLVAVLAAMAQRSLIAANITAPALVHVTDECRPTLFIDEASSLLTGSTAMRAIVNSGHNRRTAYVVRLANPTEERSEDSNGQMAPGAAIRKFSCWCPKVVALTGEIPEAIADRSIVVKMSRRLLSEPCAPLTELDASGIRAKCARFAADAADAIRTSEVIRGDVLNDRAADTFDSLFVIAKLAGEEWLKKIQAAAVSLTADTDRMGAGFLLDIISVFTQMGVDRLFSRDLTYLLREGAGDFRYGTSFKGPLNEKTLAKALRVYGITPTTIRINTEVKRGYETAQFRQAAKRYVPVTLIGEQCDEITKRSQLQQEASAERKKEEADFAAEEREVEKVEVEEKDEEEMEFEANLASLEARIEKAYKSKRLKRK